MQKCNIFTSLFGNFLYTQRMGCCSSLCGPKEYADVEGRFPVIEICESDSGSDNELKAKGTSKDVTPLLEGPSLLAFHNLNLSSTSSSVDLEMDQIESILKVSEQKSDTSLSEGQPEDNNKTFEDVRPDLDLNEFNSSDAEKDKM